jgi:hypothetical protein
VAWLASELDGGIFVLVDLTFIALGRFDALLSFLACLFTYPSKHPVSMIDVESPADYPDNLVRLVILPYSARLGEVR